MVAFEFVVAHRADRSGPGFDVYEADVSVTGLAVGERTVVEHFDVTLAPESAVDLFTAAAVAEDRLALSGFRVLDHITSYGSFGKGVLVR